MNAGSFNRSARLAKERRSTCDASTKAVLIKVGTLMQFAIESCVMPRARRLP
jgi:hypothetical protein